MSSEKYVLAINPGSTSTKVAVFKDDICISQKSLNHTADELKKFERVTDQFRFRTELIRKWLSEEKIDPETLDAVVGRGGLLCSIPGGTYIVTDIMIEDLKMGVQGEHAANLGGIIAREIADNLNIPSFIVDPVAVDEFEDIARLSGMPEIRRRSLVHALNIKSVSRRVSNTLGKSIEELNFVAAHLGGGISIVPVKRGRIVDANNASEDGPFSPDRTGGLPAASLVNISFSGKYDEKQLRKKILGGGGLIAYLGTNDAREVEKMIKSGDKNAALVFEAMCYQISKEICAMAAVLCGDVDAVILTGGLAYSNRLVALVSDRVKFIAPVIVVPGEDEMFSLAQGALRVLNGEEKAKIYEDEVLDR